MTSSYLPASRRIERSMQVDSSRLGLICIRIATWSRISRLGMGSLQRQWVQYHWRTTFWSIWENHISWPIFICLTPRLSQSTRTQHKATAITYHNQLDSLLPSLNCAYSPSQSQTSLISIAACSKIKRLSLVVHQTVTFVWTMNSCPRCRRQYTSIRASESGSSKMASWVKEAQMARGSTLTKRYPFCLACFSRVIRHFSRQA